MTAAVAILAATVVAGLVTGTAVGVGGTEKVAKAGPPSSKTRMRYVKTITGHISPKSVVSSGRGLVFAQNMMYTHTVTVYNARTRRLVKTISDAVNLGRYGVKGHAGVSRGAPVELAFTPNGSTRTSPITRCTATGSAERGQTRAIRAGTVRASSTGSPSTS